MSTNRPAPPAARPAGPAMRGPFGGMGPPQKAKHFRSSGRRLLGLLAPERRLISVVIAFAIASVSLSVAGPRILGRATDLIFAGFFGGRLPANLTHEQAVASLRAGLAVCAWFPELRRMD